MNNYKNEIKINTTILANVRSNLEKVSAQEDNIFQKQPSMSRMIKFH